MSLTPTSNAKDKRLPSLQSPTAEEVKAFRAQHGCSMEAAKRSVIRSYAIEAVESAESVSDLKIVLLAILNNDI